MSDGKAVLSPAILHPTHMWLTGQPGDKSAAKLLNDSPVKENWGLDIYPPCPRLERKKKAAVAVGVEFVDDGALCTGCGMQGIMAGVFSFTGLLAYNREGNQI